MNNSTTPPTGNAKTTVGAFSLAHSYYGTFDQGGNVQEWIDGVGDGGRVVRGGSWNTYGDLLGVGTTGSTDATSEWWDAGIAAAIIPEPTVEGMMVIGTALLAWKRKRTL